MVKRRDKKRELRAAADKEPKVEVEEMEVDDEVGILDFIVHVRVLPVYFCDFCMKTLCM